MNMFNFEETEMLSCDTMAAGKARSAYNSNMFAKNSDRPTGESQPLVYVAAADHTETEVEITGMKIPQVPHTYGVLGSAPYWIWGFEMGVNEHGVVIGNEAEFGKELGRETEMGILGMDLLRLGLERGKTAREALDVIVELLEKYGQKRSANVKSDSACYDNSFMIVDPEEVWILETAGRRWIAKKENGVCNIGNTYSLRGEYDLASADLEEHAREEKWLFPDEPFNFAKAYVNHTPYQTLAQMRRRRVLQLGERVEKHTEESLKAIFRDHYEDEELIAPVDGASSGIFPTVCRHSVVLNTSQTAASWLTWYKEGLGTMLRAAFSQPCCSVFLPVYFGTELPEMLTLRDGLFNENSLWWQMERLGKAVSLDYDRFAPAVKARFAALEEKFEGVADAVEAEYIALKREGRENEGLKVLGDFTRACAEETMKAVKEEFAKVSGKIHELGGLAGPRMEYLQEYCREYQMEI